MGVHKIGVVGIAVGLAYLAGLTATASASDPVAGSLDPTWGASGTVQTSFSNPSWVKTLVVQDDGKVVAAGTSEGPPADGLFGDDVAVARYAGNGDLDPSFAGGKVETDFGGAERVEAVAVQPDGKIVVAGSDIRSDVPYMRLFLARYNADGTVDTGFGTDGRVYADQITGDLNGNQPVDLNVADDGTILAAVTYDVPQSGGGIDHVALLHFAPNGSLDPSFGDNGIADAPLGNAIRLGSINLLDNGQALATGTASPNGSGDNQSAIVRLDPDGRLDSSFGGDGVVTVNALPGRHDQANASIVDGAGNVVVVGEGDPSELILMRLNHDGSLDPSFGTDGVFSEHAFGGTLQVVLQPNRKIMTFGSGMVYRFLADGGGVDTSFGIGGTPEPETGAGYTYISRLEGFATAEQNDGNFLVAGTKLDQNSDADSFEIARLIGDDPLPEAQITGQRSMKKPGRKSGRKKKFKFVSTRKGYRFQCKLAGETNWRRCHSPVTYRGLHRGKHTFRVRLIWPQGLTDPNPDQRRWRVRG